MIKAGLVASRFVLLSDAARALSAPGSLLMVSWTWFCRPLFSAFTSGDKVSKDDVVGEVSDYFGNALQTLTAQASGIIMMINETPPVTEGESPVAIGIAE